LKSSIMGYMIGEKIQKITIHPHINIIREKKLTLSPSAILYNAYNLSPIPKYYNIILA